MATHTIKIIHDGKLLFEKHPNQVRPGNAYVSPGDKVIFSTRNTNIEIFLPPQTQYLLNASNNVIPITAPGKSQTFIIQNIGSDEKIGSPKRRFPYAVYCEAGNDFAEGGSAPQMIVE